MGKLIDLSSITVKYGEVTALSEIDLTIEEGEFVGIIGPNGSGKTTLLKLILGLLKPTSGQMTIFDQAHSLRGRLRSQIGYIPQYQQIDKYFPIKVFDVVMMGRISQLGFFHQPKKRDREVVLNALEKVSMSEYAQTPFGQLSSGQQQRIAFARVLAQEARMLLLDEPTSGIDLAQQHNLLSLIDQLHQVERITILYVAHEISILSRYIDKIICLNKRLHCVGPPDEVLTPGILEPLLQTQVKVIPYQDYSFFIIEGKANA